MPPSDLIACPACGLIQRCPQAVAAGPAPLSRARPAGVRLVCARCAERLPHTDPRHEAASRNRVLALSLAALILYPAAMMLPVMRIERLGHGRETTIWSGAVALIRDGHAAIGLLVLVCSVIIPLAKLAALIMLTWPGLARRLPGLPPARRHLIHRVVEWLGRWGMVDVLLVAVLIAAVKLGDLMSVHAGPGVTAFGGVVVLSLLASAFFDPRSIWLDEPVALPKLSKPTTPRSQSAPIRT